MLKATNRNNLTKKYRINGINTFRIKKEEYQRQEK